MDVKTRYTYAKKVTFLGAVVNAFLGIIKVVFGILGQSNALFADGIHSFSDLVTDILVIVASRFGSQAADIDHPYGHGRIETAGTMFLSMLLIVAGFGIIYHGVWDMVLSTTQKPSTYVLLIVFISIAANEILFHVTKFVAIKIKSELILANAWHHRSDALSSVVVLFGVVAALLGYPQFDPIAAVIVGLMVCKMGWQLGWSSIRELVDTGVDQKTLLKMRAVIVDVTGVKALHQLRTRSMGGNILVDVHVLVSPRISVSEGHHISQRVHFYLKQEIPAIRDVIVHIDPEDDEIVAPSLHLPDRDALQTLLLQCWQTLPGADQIADIAIHYLAGKIEVEVSVPLTIMNNKNDLNELTQRYQQALAHLDNDIVVRLLYTAVNSSAKGERNE